MIISASWSSKNLYVLVKNSSTYVYILIENYNAWKEEAGVDIEEKQSVSIKGQVLSTKKSSDYGNLIVVRLISLMQ